MLDTLPFTSDTGEARAAPPRGPPRPPLPLPRNVMRDLRAGLLLAGAPLPLPEKDGRPSPAPPRPEGSDLAYLVEWN